MSAALLQHTLALCHVARAAGLAVTPARTIDVCRALEVIDCAHAEDYRVALRANLVTSRAEEILFDRLFDRHFGRRQVEDDGHAIMARSELLRGTLDAGRANEGHRDMQSPADSFSAEPGQRRANLAARWDAAAPPLAQVIRELARRLATRPSRRWRATCRGGRVDLRRSVRRNVRHGLDMVELARVAPKLRKTRIVMLCDVSGSMDVFNPFLLQLMFGLQQALKASRTLVFSTRVSDITAALRHRSIDATLRAIADQVRHWSGGTDIGAALGALNRGVLCEGSSRATVLLVISDGYDNGEPARIAAELELARRQVRTLVWINPMFGASTFEIRAAGMKAAMPYIDHFLPAYNAQALHALVKGLAKV